MDDLTMLQKKLIKNPAFREEYERTRPEFQITRALIKARCEQNLTQKELAEKTGIRQSNISRIESGACSPNVATLHALAKGLGKELHIEFK